MASGVGGLPDDSIPAPWPEASAEGSALARSPLKRWGFRGLAPSTRVLETDREPHAEASRFPGKGGRDGGEVIDQRTEVAGTFVGGRIAVPGPACDKGRRFWVPAGGHMRTCDWAHCHLCMQADMQIARQPCTGLGV